MKILVTGAAGFIGHRVAVDLAREGHELYLVDDMATSVAPARLLADRLHQVERVRGSTRFAIADLADPDACAFTFREARPDAVVHMAARAGVQASVADPRATMRANVDATLNVLEGCREHGAVLVAASSSSVYGDRAAWDGPFTELDPLDPASPYAASKVACEALANAYAEAHGVRSTMLRFFTVYGPRGRPDMAPWILLERMHRGQTLEVYGNQERDFTYVDDAADAVVRALHQLVSVAATGKDAVSMALNVGAGHMHQVTALIAALAEAANLPANIVVGPPRAGDVNMTWADSGLAHGMLGWTPRVSLEDGCRRFAEWYAGWVR